MLLCPGLSCFHRADVWGQVRRAPEEPEWQQGCMERPGLLSGSSWHQRASPQCLLRLPARGPSAPSPLAGGEALPTAPSWDRPWQASWCVWRVPSVPGELLCQGRGSRGLPAPPGAEPLREDQAEAPKPLAAPAPRQVSIPPPACEDSHCL